MRSAARRYVATIALPAVTAALVCGAAAGATERNQLTIEQVGFRGHYKVGYWTPVRVSLRRGLAHFAESSEQNVPVPLSADGSGIGSETGKSFVELTSSDSDSVSMSVSAPVSEGIATTQLYTKIGRIDSTIDVTLAVAGAVVERATVGPQNSLGDGATMTPLPATAELIVQIGAAQIGLSDAFPDRDGGERGLTRRVVRMDRTDELPLDWFGYEAVDVLVLSTNDAELCRRLAADERRFDALRRWLELGGRLVVCCGRNAPELLAEGGPLADLVPGTFVELVRLPQTQGLENYAATPSPIGSPGVSSEIAVPRLVDVSGRVEVFGRGRDLPLVVRAARGLGELVFVGVDLDTPPLAEWSGRKTMWRALLLPYVADADAPTHTATLVSSGYVDLAGALRQRLGRSFEPVTPVSFPLVAGLIIGYLILLGPLDYLLVHKLLRRPGAAWVTFPLVLLLTCGVAVMVAAAYKRDVGQQLNRAELVDFDLTTGRARGTCWATLYSSRASRYDVALRPRWPNGDAVEQAGTLISWLGLPGTGLGGMHSSGLAPVVAETGYQLSPTLDELSQLPVLTASTKSLWARWDAVLPQDVPPPCAAELEVDDDGLLVGTLVNQTGVRLTDACLLHGTWGYLLGNLDPGERIDVAPLLKIRKVNSIVTQRAGRSLQDERAAGRPMFIADRASLDELLYAIMFHAAAGGDAFTGLPSRYHAYCDLSRLLTLDRAVLVAGGSGSGSQWLDPAASQPLDGEQDTSIVMYRFVLPVTK